MFKLMLNKENLFAEAAIFTANNMPDEEVTINNVTISVGHDPFPCLVDMVVNHNWAGKKIFNSHICTRKTAKCLIYPKTNRVESINWFRMDKVRDISKTIHKSRYFSTLAKLIMTSGFDEEVGEIEDGEPFLISVKTILHSDRTKLSNLHISIVPRKKALELVYYKKNDKHGVYFPDLLDIY